MSQRVIRIAEIATIKGRAGLLPVSQRTVWRWVRKDKFPKPFKLGEGVTVWDAAEVERFVSERSMTVSE